MRQQDLSDAIGLEIERRECNHFWRAVDSRRSQCAKCGEIEKAPCREPECVAMQARIEAAIEVYAGMEGFIPETAAEGYCLRIIDEMNKALQETNHE